jgi:heme A synthase
MTAVLSFHRGLFFAGVVITIVVGVWGLVMFFRRRPPGGALNSALVLTEGLFVLQGLVGIALFAGGRRPHDALHWLYGVLLVIALPIAMSYSSGRAERRQSLVYGLAGLFMAGLAIRAVMTS